MTTPDTTEAISRILVNLYLGANTTEKMPNWQARMKNPELAEARAALMAIVREARVDEQDQHYTYTLDDNASDDYKEGFKAAIDQTIKISERRIADLKQEGQS